MRAAEKIHFAQDDAFHAALKARVAQHFAETGRSPKGGAAMIAKTVILFAWLAASWAVLVFAPLNAWQAVACVISLALAIAGIGFGVMHDANHGAYGDGARANAWMSRSLDLLGGSSFLWRQAHNVLHHSYTNVSGLDIDLEMSSLLRVAPWHQRRPWHRLQHLYIALLFGIFPIKWWLYDDVHMFVVGRPPHAFPRARGAVLAKALAFKAVFLAWAVVIPAALHPAWKVIALWLCGSFVLGNVLGWVFQLAHCVASSKMIEARPGERLDVGWAAHQVRTSVDFARGSTLLSWYLGGLNFQIEHHLFPQICHTHYPALAPIVEEVCEEHGVRYLALPSLKVALAANFDWLRAMGRAD